MFDSPYGNPGVCDAPGFLSCYTRRIMTMRQRPGHLQRRPIALTFGEAAVIRRWIGATRNVREELVGGAWVATDIVCATQPVSSLDDQGSQQPTIGGQRPVSQRIFFTHETDISSVEVGAENPRAADQVLYKSVYYRVVAVEDAGVYRKVLAEYIDPQPTETA